MTERPLIILGPGDGYDRYIFPDHVAAWRTPETLRVLALLFAAFIISTLIATVVGGNG